MQTLKSLLFGEKKEKPICIVLGEKEKLKVGDTFDFNSEQYKISRISKMCNMILNRPNVNAYILFGTKEKNKNNGR